VSGTVLRVGDTTINKTEITSILVEPPKVVGRDHLILLRGCVIVYLNLI
jgi:hypothetical protein